MSIPVSNGIPISFTAGDTVIFTENFSEYGSDVWTLAVWLALPAGAPVSFAGVTSGKGFQVTMATGASELPPGQYRYSEVLSSIAPGQRVTPKEGVIWALPDYTSQQSQTLNQQMLAALNAAILALVGGTNESTNFNGQSFTKKDVQKLYDLRVQLQAQVLHEQQIFDRLRGGRDPGRIGTEFLPACGGGFRRGQFPFC